MIGESKSRTIKPIAIQHRDETIMMLVAEFRFLSREQLQVLLDFPCITRINIRLKKLFDHGYLSRFFLPDTRKHLTISLSLKNKLLTDC